MIDKFGLIVQENSDGGDCPNRTGSAICYFAAAQHSPSVNNFIMATQTNLMPQPNVYWRYPTTYNQTNDFSRDQASRLMLGYGMAGRKDLIKGYYWLLIKNRFKHQNGDLLGTGEPANFIRSMGWWWFWPLLLILDIKFLYDVLFGWRVQSWDYDNLFCIDLWFAKNKLWTPFAWLASKLYNQPAAVARIYKNLGDEKIGCREAKTSDVWFIQNL